MKSVILDISNDHLSVIVASTAFATSGLEEVIAGPELKFFEMGQTGHPRQVIGRQIVNFGRQKFPLLR